MNTIKRRKILRNIGAASGVAISSSLIPHSAAAQSNSTKLSSKEEKKAINNMLSDADVQSLIEHHEEIGSIKKDTAYTVSAPLNGEQAQIVRISFTVNEDALSDNVTKIEDPYILWSDSEDSNTIAAYIIYDEEGERRTINYHPPAISKEVETQSISNGYVAPEGGDDTSMQPNMVTPPCGYTKIVNWSCVEQTVKRNSKISRSCSTCAAALYTGANPVSVVACGWCTWDLYNQGISSPGCNLCTN